MKNLFARLALITCSLCATVFVSAQRPVIASVSPSSAPIGAPVIITGTGFNATTSNNTVYFGTVKATVTLASTTSLTVTVPPGAAFQYVNVVNATSRLGGYSRFPFATNFSGCMPLNAGSFAAKTDFSTDLVPRSVAFADLDNDGKADMITTNNGTDNISVLRNTSTAGTISFQPRVNFLSGTSLYSAASGVATGDLNGDGKLDIVITNYNSSNISVFMNTTVGSTITFAPKVEFTTAMNSLGVVIGDFDSDGKPDIAVANWVAPTASITLLRNTSTSGTLSFATQSLVTGMTQPRELAMGDLDGDGKPDLVVADEVGLAVVVHRNTSVSGTISFGSPVSRPTQDRPRGVGLADLDGDGKLDIALVNSFSASVSVYLNTSVPGTISITPQAIFNVGISPREIALGDIDGDGRPEIVASSNLATGSSVTGLRNISSVGNISFATMISFPAGSNALGVALQDVDNDGKLDLAATSNSTASVGVFRNLPITSTLAAITPTTFTNPVVCDNSTWQTLYNPGTGRVVAGVRYNNNNLGTLTGAAYVESQPGTVSNGQRFMARHFVVGSSIAPATPVQVRLYFTNAELLAMQAVDPSIQSISDLSVTSYTGPGEDGVFNLTGGTAAIIPHLDITTGTAFGANYLEFTTLSFGEFWVHSGYLILPASITRFTAHDQGKDILLSWTTSAEQNLDRFIVESSGDGIDYTAIGSVSANGNQLANPSYSFRDARATTGNNFYRLVLVDLKGRKTLSKSLLVTRKKSTGADEKHSLLYLPGNVVRFNIATTTNGVLHIYDQSGRKMKSYKLTAPTGSFLDVDLNGYSTGLCFFQLIGEDGLSTSGKLIVR